MNKRVLYLSYDGLTDPLGQSQILPYLAGCAEAGHLIDVVSFEKPDRMVLLGPAVSKRCKVVGLRWHPRTFRQSPPYVARALDQSDLKATALRLAAQEQYDLVHCRSYPSAVAGLMVKRQHGIPLLFDMRGFWPDSRLEGGRWRKGHPLGAFLYRRWKEHEQALFLGSDHIVAMADAAREAIRSMAGYQGAPLSMIACCCDFELFRPSPPTAWAEARNQLGIPSHAPVMVYVGSLGTIYRLRDQLRLFDALRRRRPGLRLLFVGREPRATILNEAVAAGIALSENELHMIAAERASMPHWISAGDIGTCFYTPTFSSLNVSPTKLAEYLACGVPAIGNEQVGDVASILRRTGGGHAIADFSQTSIEAAADKAHALIGIDRHRLRSEARKLLDLPLAVQAYRTLYADLSAPVSVG